MNPEDYIGREQTFIKHNSGTPKQSVNNIDNTESKALGLRYRGTEGLRRYIQELVDIIYP